MKQKSHIKINRLWLKLHLRDLLSILRQSLGLPHNKIRSQVTAIKATFDPEIIDRQRINLIVRAAAHEPDTILAFVDELSQPEWDEFSNSKLWNERGTSMMSMRDRTTLYALVRTLKPEMCVETGAGGGSASTYILSALEINGVGKLFSIDVESPYANEYGGLIPKHLHPRWNLRIQRDKPVLPKLLKELGVIDFFLHDSEHSVEHMTWEFELAWQHLRSGGCLASHDVICTTSFEDFYTQHASHIAGGGIIANFGFWIKK